MEPSTSNGANCRSNSRSFPTVNFSTSFNDSIFFCQSFINGYPLRVASTGNRELFIISYRVTLYTTQSLSLFHQHKYTHLLYDSSQNLRGPSLMQGTSLMPYQMW